MYWFHYRTYVLIREALWLGFGIVGGSWVVWSRFRGTTDIGEFGEHLGRRHGEFDKALINEREYEVF
jgi:hypothetical protein